MPQFSHEWHNFQSFPKDIVDSYSDPRIRYLRNPSNLGPEDNWNCCLQEARGKYFKLLPQDDVLYPETLKTQVEILERDASQSIALVFGSRTIIDADGRELTRRGYPRSKEGRIPGDTLIRRCVRYGTNLIGEPGGVLMRKTLTNAVGSFDGSIPYVIDLDYWVRLLRHGDAYYLTEPVSAFRVSSGSWSVAIGSRQSGDYRRFIKKLGWAHGTPIRFLDSIAGSVMAELNKFMRLIFYKLTVR